MPSLLLEIGAEELPAAACYEAEAQLPELVRAHLGVTLPGRELRAVIPEQIDRLVHGFSFAKSMRWDDTGMRFARPVRWLLAKLDDETIVGETSFGHRFTHGPVKIPSAAAYAEAL